MFCRTLVVPVHSYHGICNTCRRFWIVPLCLYVYSWNCAQHTVFLFCVSTFYSQLILVSFELATLRVGTQIASNVVVQQLKFFYNTNHKKERRKNHHTYMDLQQTKKKSEKKSENFESGKKRRMCSKKWLIPQVTTARFKCFRLITKKKKNRKNNERRSRSAKAEKKSCQLIWRCDKRRL